MSDKQQKYQEMHRQYEDSPGALNAQMMEQENLERQKGLPGDDAYKFLMDADQLKEYYENRNRDTAENSFKVRTRYYFEDLNRAEVKAKRYETLAGKEAAIEAYQQKHGGRQTHKRVNDVKNASSSFRKMQQKMADQARKNQNRQNLTPLQKYTQREEIMKLRMDGMVAAAQLKSKPGNMHHLMTRAKYSCYMILKDQLTHLIKEPQSAQDKRKLEGKLKAVNSKLDSIFLDLKKYTPSIQKQWQEEHFSDVDYDTAQAGYQSVCKAGVEVSKEAARTLFHLRKFHQRYGEVQWPARCVYKTKEGNAPINPAERKMQEWNDRVQDIRENGSDYAKRRVEEEGIRIFMNTELPSAKTLKTMGTKYLEENLRTYYEMTQLALPYYQAEIKKEKGFLYEYAERHSDFREKLDYVETIKMYMEYRLQIDHGIRTDEEHGYAISKDGAGYAKTLEKHLDRYDRAQMQEDMKDQIETILDQAEKHYGKYQENNGNTFELMPDIPTQALRPLAIDDDDDEDDEDYDDDEQVIEHRQARREQAAPQQVRQQEEQVAPQQQVQQEQNIEIRENRLFSDMIVKEEKKEEEKKEEVQENVIIEEEKEEPKQENLEKKEAFQECIILDEEEELPEELKKEEEQPEQIFQTKLAGDVVRKNKLAGDVRRKNAAPDEDDGPLVEDDISDQKKISFEDAAEQVEKILAADREKAAKEKEEEDRKKAAKAEEDRKVAKQIAEGKRIVAEREAKQRAAAEKKELKIEIIEEPKKRSAKKKSVVPKKELKIEIIEKNKNVINENKIIEKPKNTINVGPAIETKEEREEKFREESLQPALGLTKAHFSKKATKTQKKEVEFARKRYDLLHFYTDAGKMDTLKAYQDLYKKTGYTISMDRQLTAGMKPVLFDKNGQPLPQYLENHKWNLKWLQAWVDKDDKKREQMIQEYYPHMLDDVQESDFPEVKLSKTNLATMKSYKKLLADEKALDQKMEVLRERLTKEDPKAENKKNPKYAQYIKELKELQKNKMPLMNKVLEVARSYVSGKQFQSWATKKVEDRSVHEAILYQKGRALGSVEELEQVCPSVKEIERCNPKFVQKGKLLEKSSFIFNNYVTLNYGVQIAGNNCYKTDWLLDDQAKSGGVSEQAMFSVVEYLTTWMDYYYEETQGQEDDAAVLAELQEVNPKFQKKDLGFYKKAKSFKELTDNPIYKKYDLKETREKYNLRADSVTLDRFARIGFRPVTFDKLNQPVTKEDEANHAWNLKWLKAWQQDDVETREAMIGEQLSRIFEEISMPQIKLTAREQEKLQHFRQVNAVYEKAKREDDACKEDAPEKKQLEKTRADALKQRNAAQKEIDQIGDKYWKTYAGWLEGLAEKQDFKWWELMQIMGCLDKLEKIHPSIAYFLEKNPALRTLFKMSNYVGTAFAGTVASKRYRLSLGTKVEALNELTRKDDVDGYEEGMTYDTTQFLIDKAEYDTQKSKKRVPFVPLSCKEFTLTDPAEKEEYAAQREKHPNLTPKSYRILKVLDSTHSVVNHEEYAEEYRRAKDVLKGAGDLSRDAMLVMRHVDFDQKGKPKTKEDEENHAWNKQWLKAIDEDDFELREKMLSEEVPKRFWIKDLPKPSEALLALHRQMQETKNKKGWAKSPEGQKAEEAYREELNHFLEEAEQYTEKKLRENDVAFFYELESGQSLDKLEKAHPSLQKYLNDNPEIKQRSSMIFSFMTMAGSYLGKKYYIDGSTTINDDVREEHLRTKASDNQMIEESAAVVFLDAYLKHQEVEKNDPVPYQMIITDEDRQRKEKRKAMKANKAKTAQKKAEVENKKRYADLAKQYKKENPEFNEDHIGSLVKTNLRGNTFKNKEYLALAKKVTLMGFGNDLSGPMSVGLETIEMDEKGNVLPEYKEAHERNLAWLNMLIKAGETDELDEVKKHVEQVMSDLVKEFTLPDKHDLSSYSGYRLVMKNPVTMKTCIQKIQAYEKLKSGCPEVSVSGAKKKALRENIRLLQDAVPLLLDNIKVNQGIDFSKDEYKVIKPKERSNAKEKEHVKKMDAYLKGSDAFLRKD